ncbi:MAG TPA: ABC transporter substrate-binding protein [Conexibacter sp.]|nr:ABC transporter substrate-binding protein [Conexibacter sp.]
MSSGGVLLAACGSDSKGGTGGVATAPKGTPPTKPTGVARLAMLGPVATLDPARKGDYQSYYTTEAAYDGLTNWSQDPTRLAAGLATSWQSNADATEWTFTLRDGVTFHDGEPLTSESVKKSMEHYLRGKGSYMGAYVGTFSSIDASDPKKVVIRYKDPFPDLARNMPWLGIISAKALTGSPDQIAKRLDARSAGAGAFVITRSPDGGTVTGDAFGAYWGAGPYLQQLVFRAVPVKSAQVSALRSNDLQWIPQVVPQTLSSLQGAFNTSGQVGWLQYMVNFACDLAPTDNAQVRQAISYAIDREAILKAVLQGQGEVANSFMPPGCYGSQTTNPRYDFDAARAKSMISRLGSLPTVQISYDPNSDLDTQIAQVMAQQVSEAGLKTIAHAINSAEAGNEYDPSKKRLFGMSLQQFGWINGGPFFFAPGGAYNLATLCRYRNQAFDALMVRANAVADSPQRLDALHVMQDFFAREAVVLPLFNLLATDVFSRDLQGYVTAKDGFGPRFNGMYYAKGA